MPRHQRAEMMTDLLDATRDVTVEKAIALAFDTQVYRAELWQARLKTAWDAAPASAKSADSTRLYSLIEKWNRRSDADSTGALAYYAFKRHIAASRVSQVTPAEDLHNETLLKALEEGAKWLQSNFGSLEVPYGKYFRVGRRGGDRTFPVGGGSVADAGMSTTRAIGFDIAGKEMVGRSGQTSTQIVHLTDPPESWTIVPLGASDHKESGHWDDQAEKLFSKSKAAPTYFLRKSELLKHVTSKKELVRESPKKGK
jgi:acyl-homoserine lactone acylase PvdQ